ncbi:death-inducer obliterator 1-like [Lolium rigidum]|uniref:death-inducer obliterator 1-like n=1 Tax=Lolium rigidum TaxID=89674 RepID=UPI001F5CD9A3|nr:death-inducer obliterator 1-like [Lolium rigidum]
MELSKQGQEPMPASMGSQALPSSNIQSTQPGYPAVFYPPLSAGWNPQPMFPTGASVPVSSYYIMPMSQQAVQAGASRPEASHPLGAQVQSMSRVSLRPPQQVLNVQTSLPVMMGSQLSPSVAGKKLLQTAASPKVQMMKSALSAKRPAQKELSPKVQPQPQPQQFESVRSKFRESLSAALMTDSDQQDKKQAAENLQPDGSADQKKKVEGDEVQDLVSITSKDASTTNSEAGNADGEKDEIEKLASGLVSDVITITDDDMQQQLNHLSSEDEALGQSMVVADELLQGHGLSWVSDFDIGISEPMAQPNLKRDRTCDVESGVTESLTESESKRMKSADEAAADKGSIIQKAERLAFRIEEELFKLFGGVNKKYKERGRSLLFNLKDKGNPELRLRVISGDIPPERLCSMTAEELASKELSEWRLAKAEEHEKMVVLPNTEVDIKRLVRKTHKGEFQVEIEEPDGISVEVELGGNVLSHVPSKPVEDESKTNDETSMDDKAGVEGKDRGSDGMSQDEDGGSGDNDSSGNVDYIENEKADLIDELMVDDLKDAENLPPIPSLDEFMLGLDSEPPFENLSVGTPQKDLSDSDEPSSTLQSEKLPETEDKLPAEKKTESESDGPSLQVKSESKSESPKHEVGSNLVPDVPPNGQLIKSSPDRVESKEPAAANISNPVSTKNHVTTTVPMIRESIWEGAIQLTLSSLTNVVAIFKSGEKPSGKEWRSLIEIKGRVKLSAFQEFLEQLPKSRSRAIMVTELLWKEGSLESGRQHLSQTIDSYIADERVGLAEPADGLELYLCPPQGKTVEILSRHLPKEHLDGLAVAATSIIGIVVWRRPNVPRIPSHQRHEGSKRQSILGTPQVTGSTSVRRSSALQNSYGAPPGFPNQRHKPEPEEDVTDDVPPGFGPGVVARRDEDDLPEFNFVNSSNPAANVTTHAFKGRQHVPARPVEHIRELVQKYGKRSSIESRRWDDDDDDDIPEWNPIQQSRLTQTQQPLPPPPPLPPIQQIHPYQQQQYNHPNAMQPLQQQVPSNNPLLSQAYLQQLQQQQLQPSQTWQQQPNAWWPAQAQGVAAGSPAPVPQYVVTVPNSNSAQGAQGYSAANLGGMPWRPR